jgi:transcriptional regulator with XRE-family HTH domain
VPRKEIHPIDVYAGSRLREARLLRGMNQSQLGKALSQPITFQQVQKYERGANRISVSRLCEFAEALQLPPSYFLPNSEIPTLSLLSSKEAKFLENFRQLPQSVQDTLTNLLNTLRGG